MLQLINTVFTYRQGFFYASNSYSLFLQQPSQLLGTEIQQKQILELYQFSIIKKKIYNQNVLILLFTFYIPIENKKQTKTLKNISIIQ